MKKNNIVDKIMAKAAYNAATQSANRICAYFFYQPKLPKSVKKLRKF